VIGQLAWQRRDEAVLVDPARPGRYRREGLADPGAVSWLVLMNSSRLPVGWLVMG
jgi:hypothetical protein